MDGLSRAIDAAGGVAALARILGHTYYSTVTNWRRRGVPLHAVSQIENALNGAVRAEEIRPDVTWHRDAAGRLTGYTVPVPSGSQAA